MGSRYGQTNQLLQEVKRLLEGCEAFPHPGFLPTFTAHIRKDSFSLLESYNRAKDGTLTVPSEYLEAVAIRR